MKITINQIEKILIQEDIEGLLELGAPLSEYRDEAVEIANSLLQLQDEYLNQTNVVLLLRRIWTVSFGPFSEQELRLRTNSFKNIAKEILT